MNKRQLSDGAQGGNPRPAKVPKLSGSKCDKNADDPQSDEDYIPSSQPNDDGLDRVEMPKEDSDDEKTADDDDSDYPEIVPPPRPKVLPKKVPEKKNVPPPKPEKTREEKILQWQAWLAEDKQLQANLARALTALTRSKAAVRKAEDAILAHME